MASAARGRSSLNEGQIAREVVLDQRGQATRGADEQARLIAALRDPARHGPWCSEVRVAETHISYVLLTGRYAYKIKKSVDLGFLDFTTLEARRYYCELELALNRRFAPDLYLDVVAMTGTPDAPVLAGDGQAIEYAVRMREFPQDALLSSVLARGALTASHIDQLSAAVATFHASASRAPADSRFGAPAMVLDLALENFDEMDPLVDNPGDRRDLAELRRWTARDHAVNARAFAHRAASGFVRECHGDLHLGNIALVDGRLTMFDCVEFNDAMRWGDVMSDVAFVVMDLHDRGRPDLASRFLNGYLEFTGDYAGVAVLRFYVVYRAMVRAKVACLRGAQAANAARHRPAMKEFREYVGLARRVAETRTPGIVITHGPAGSGKTTATQAFVELTGAIRLRTDVERKRLHGAAATARSRSPLNAGWYTPDATERTYATTAARARTVAAAGHMAVVDGTFLQREQRRRFRELAAAIDVPFVIVDFVARPETLRSRVLERTATGRDASEADLRVLEHQLLTAEALGSDERIETTSYDADQPLDRARDITTWQPVLGRLRGQECGTAHK